MIEVEYIYIEEIQDDEKIELEDDEFSYFKVFDDHFDIIDEYDYINLKGAFRFDIKNGKNRIYPIIGKTSLYYDEVTHTLLSSALVE